MLAPQWQIALAVLVGFLIGTLCTWLACRIADTTATPGPDKVESVGADAQGQQDGAPQGRPRQSTPAPGAPRDQQNIRPWHKQSARIQWFIDPQSWGGLLPERLLAALPLGDPSGAGEGLYCGLVLSMSTTGKPTMEYWERIDDLERQGFGPISAARAKAICDGLPRFLERLDQASGERRAAIEGAD